MSRVSPDTSTASAGTFVSTGRASLHRAALLNAFAAMRRGHLRMELPGGGAVDFGSHAESAGRTLAPGLSAEAHLHVRREAFFRKCIFSGDIGFAESYLDGDWETPDLTSLIGWFLHNLENAPTLSGSANRGVRTWPLNLLRVVNRIGHTLRFNSPANARRNIGAHYDLSNEFFALFLDPSMMYSAAKWTAPTQSLEEAQREKNDALCRDLRLGPGDHVLEIGTGWGGWSLHAARTYGCKVTTLTLSHRQRELARQRIAAAGLADRIDVRLQDYRELDGRFDKVVSIEMLEAVGHRFLPAFCETIDRVLKPDGLLALQFITCPDHRYDQFRRGVDFIQKHIFPGSLLLSLNRVNDRLARAGGFVLNRMTDFGPDYARTLRLWREAFHARLDDVRALGFDDRFIRKWEYYLCYCEAAFAMRNISVVHTLHTRANNLSL